MKKYAEKSPESQPDIVPIAANIKRIRVAKELSQADFAERSRLKREQINYFERGVRTPSIGQLLQIAQAFDLPLQRLLTGGNRAGSTVRDLAIELRSLGLIDIWVEGPVVPGAFRRPEEVVALAISGAEPEARIVEGVPAALAWNRWNRHLLWAFARARSHSVVYRLAWLADIALAIERIGGFPGGCPGKEDLADFVKRIKKPPADRWDDLGRPAVKPSASPLGKRWHINFAADLATFRRRAEHLVTLAQAEGRSSLGREE
jgi:transcriptional regulator with XRE-family HTH domain